MTDTSRLKSTIYIGGLPQNTSAQTLHATFIPFGDIVDITIPKSDTARRRDANANANSNMISTDTPETQDTNRGFGYVEFETAADAKEAIDNMDQAELFGRVIRVAEAKPQRDGAALTAGTGEGLGSRTALWLQEGYLAANAVDQEDRMVARAARERADAGMDGADGKSDGGEDDGGSGRPEDPMQGLEGLDVAGPRDT